MVDIQPFQAIRPQAALAKQIASLPYDVLNRAEATALTKDNPYSYLHIDRSEVDLPAAMDPYDEAVYEKAKENLAIFQEKEWLMQDNEASFYIYELTFQGHQQTGLVVTASVQDYLTGQIKKHELTRYEKEIDRINHFAVTDANTSPIFLTYRDEARISDLITVWQDMHKPIYDFTSFYDTQHRVWRIDDSQLNAQLRALFAENVPALYIADGHHRSASAARVAQMRAEAGTLNEAGNYFLSVLFPASQLRIFDYNRLVAADVPDDFFEKLAADFLVKKISAEDRRPTKQRQFTLYYQQQWYQLTAKAEIISLDLVDSLDASIAQTYIFEKHFEIKDPREDQRLDFVGGIKGLTVLEEAVDQGTATFALALYPTTMTDLLTVADLGETMPPKSTWFEPKLLSGLFVHNLNSKAL